MRHKTAMPRDTRTDKRYSICIGINDYAPETGLAPLSCAENDATAMDAMLGKLGFEHRTLLLGQDATLANMDQVLGDTIFNRAKTNDLIVFFFAGHSTPVNFKNDSGDTETEVFLAPIDFQLQQLMKDSYFRQKHALGMMRLRQDFFEGEGSRKRLFMFDSCYSGDFYGPRYRDGSDQVPTYIQDKMNSGTEGRVFLASCLPYEKAQESITHGHGVFTYYLLRALAGEEPDAAWRRDGTITVDSVYKYLEDRIKVQTPVKGGVQHGSFELTRYPHLAITSALFADGEENAEGEQLADKWIDQKESIQDLLDRFVGRGTELATLWQQVEEKMEHGGHVLLTGDAGQGKSSIIAKMLEKQGLDDTAYHFVPSQPGNEYHIPLLRSLMARLIQKYHIPARYVAGESYSILREYFRKILNEISARQGREVIFLDGVDQLETDSQNRRDLSFIPFPLPPGIVIVVGTRPNETLQQLKNLTHVDQATELPGLSRGDFELLLRHHKVVDLPSAIGNVLSERLKQNPLYLGLVAEELAKQPDLQSQSEIIIARIANNPDNIFGITFARLQKAPDWNDTVRPLLGLLLVAQEPLSAPQIAQILRKAEVNVRTGIRDLGGLVARASQQKVTLFHSKLQEYLQPERVEADNTIQFSQGEVKQLHGSMARWCEQGPLEDLWQPNFAPTSTDDYQEYARRHLITHLFGSGDYTHLFEILDAGNYEQAKLRDDQSARASASDLLLGCQAAAHPASTLEEGKIFLEKLWRYTLLRTSLTSRADAYPIEAFQALLALGKEQEASGLIELVTQPEQKLAALLVMARYLLTQPERVSEGRQLYSRIYEIASTLPQSQAKTDVLSQLTAVLIQTGYFAEAEEIARELQTNSRAAEALGEVSEAYCRQQNWPLAEEIARAIEVDEAQMIRALSKLAAQHQSAARADEAERLWQETGARISTLTTAEAQDQARIYLAASYIQAQEWSRADETADILTSKPGKMKVLSQLALALTRKGLREQAETTWEKMREIKGVDQGEHDLVLQIEAMALAEVGNFSTACTIAENDIHHPSQKVAAFGHIVSCLIRNGAFEQILKTINPILRQYQYDDVDASDLDTLLIDLICQIAQAQQWEIAKKLIRSLPRTGAKYKAMIGLAIELAKTGLPTQAEEAWAEAKTMFLARTSQVKANVVSVLATVQAKTGQVAEAKKNITILPDNQAKEYVWEKLALALVDMNQIAEAEEIAKNFATTQAQRNILRYISIAQMKAGFADQALATAMSIDDYEQQSNVLCDLVTVCCQKQQWKLAEKIANQIPSSPIQGEAMKHILVGLVENGELPVAQDLAKAIDNVYRRENAWYLILTSFARIGGSKGALEKLANNIKKNERIKQKADCAILIALKQPGLAASIARTIPDSNEKSEALYNVAVSYARDRSWKQATELAGEIGDEKIYEKVCEDIAREYASAGEWQQALAFFKKIHNAGQRRAVLLVWGTLLAQQAETLLSEQIASSLSQSEEKASLLVNMAQSLANRGAELTLLRLIQRSWLNASTRSDCQYLFAMAQGILRCNPEMCAGFYESFGWVDKFIE
jgi:hypothetical protein